MQYIEAAFSVKFYWLDIILKPLVDSVWMACMGGGGGGGSGFNAFWGFFHLHLFGSLHIPFQMPLSDQIEFTPVPTISLYDDYTAQYQSIDMIYRCRCCQTMIACAQSERKGHKVQSSSKFIIIVNCIMQSSHKGHGNPVENASSPHPNDPIKHHTGSSVLTEVIGSSGYLPYRARANGRGVGIIISTLPHIVEVGQTWG